MVDKEAVTIAIGADHAGYPLKQALLETVLKGYDVIDLGTDSTAPVDYPDIARRVATVVAAGKADKGILICGTGIGMSIAAGKVRGIRAARCTEPFSAELSRRHNDANILCLGARITGVELASRTVEVWLNTPFEGGRHARRVGKIE
ncbi:ribose 5-phosphate isomerase B [Candidatus Acetothermia bacterium]|nr:ribose 5-phosphate isomerase B [Candidatus Bipolaricaulota bacterium]RLE37924.1 MAG: ribose 5-phosphate isomerase B [Candidatus Acetothermia bacterium]